MFSVLGASTAILFILSFHNVVGQPQHSSTRSLCTVQMSNFVEKCGSQTQYNQIRGYINTRNNTLALNGWDPVCCDELNFLIDNGCLDGCYNEDLTQNSTILSALGVYSSVCVGIEELPDCITQQQQQQLDVVDQQDLCEDLSEKLVQTCGQQGRDLTQNLNDEVACCWSNKCCDLSEVYLIQNCRTECSGKFSSWRGLAEGVAKQWQSACSLSDDLLECEVQQTLSVAGIEFNPDTVRPQEEIGEKDVTTMAPTQQEIDDNDVICDDGKSREEFVDALQLDTYNRTLSTFCNVDSVSMLQELESQAVDTCCSLAQKMLNSSCDYSSCYDTPVELISQQTNKLLTLWQTMCSNEVKTCDYQQALQKLTATTPTPLPTPTPTPTPLPAPFRSASIAPSPQTLEFQEIVEPVGTVNPTVRQETTIQSSQGPPPYNFRPSIQFSSPQMQVQVQVGQGQGQGQGDDQGIPIPQENTSDSTPQVPFTSFPQVTFKPNDIAPFGFPQRGVLPPPRPFPGIAPGQHPPGFPSIVDLVRSGVAAQTPIFDGMLYIPELQEFNLVLSFANFKQQLSNFRPITVLGVESVAFDQFQKGPGSQLLPPGSKDWNRTISMHVVMEQLNTQVYLDEGRGTVQTLEGSNLTVVGYMRTNEIYIAGCCSNANRAKVLIVAEFADGVLWVVDKVLYPDGVAQQIYD